MGELSEAKLDESMCRDVFCVAGECEDLSARESSVVS
jgi:hypothetical protein